MKPIIYALNILLITIVYLTLSCDNNIDWNTYLGNQSRSHFSELKQIHAGNINSLELAWEYESGQIGKYTQIQCSPITPRDLPASRFCNYLWILADHYPSK